MKRATTFTIVVFAVVLSLVAAMVLNVEWAVCVHSIEIPGHPGQSVQFIQYRTALTRGGPYYVRLSNGAEFKHPFIKSSVSVEELRRKALVEFDETTLTVRSPDGRTMAVPEYMP